MRTADTFKQRTFRLRRKGTTKIIDRKTLPLQNKFRGRIGKSKLPSGVAVEKIAHAIDSPQEKLGITFKGLAAIRQRVLRQTQAKPQPQRRTPKRRRRGRTMVFL